MLGFVLLSAFILVVLSIVIWEIHNERKYQEKRRQKLQKTEDARIEKDAKLEREKEKEETAQKNVPKKRKKLPTCTYPLFTHARLVEMGLSDEEANGFVQELIPQLEMQIPLVEEALNKRDFHQMERLTHSIKGSATNLGTGGVSDLLVECNTYLKTGDDADIAKVYLDSLKHYTQTLKEQYA